jgi:recombinational DNA repair protein RecR
LSTATSSSIDSEAFSTLILVHVDGHLTVECVTVAATVPCEVQIEFLSAVTLTE